MKILKVREVCIIKKENLLSLFSNKKETISNS